MRTKIIDWLRTLAIENHDPGTKRLFRLGLFAWMFLHTALLLPVHSAVWGPEALITHVPFHFDSWFSILSIATHPAIRDHYLVFVVGQLLLLAAGMTSWAPRVCTVLVFWFSQNVDALNPEILDGGNNLATLVLAYLMLVDTRGPGEATAGRALPRAFSHAASNVAFGLVKLQICTVYICAGLFKLNGGLWQNGMALYYLFQTDAYSHPWAYEAILRFPVLSTLGTYATVAFQYVFPLMVWNSKWRPFVLSFGVALHLGIALGMGLFTFGLAMCAMYLAFFNNATSQRILWHLDRAQAVLARNARRVGQPGGGLAPAGR